jgi:hypothetical protein
MTLLFYSFTTAWVRLLNIQTSLLDTLIGFSRPIALVGLPVGAFGLFVLIYFRTDGTASARSRRLFIISRLLIITLLIIGAAGPYSIATVESAGDPSVTLLVDNSSSMSVSPTVADQLETDIEETGMPVRRSQIATANTSRLGDSIAANLRQNSSVVVLSDGQRTGGQSLAETAEFARSLNATISSVSPDAQRTEQYVSIEAPQKTSVGVTTQIGVTIQGVEASEELPIRILIDGEEVNATEISTGTGQIQIQHTFDSVGSHQIRAEIASDDLFEVNNIARATTRVVQQPRILYISRGSYPFESYLSQLYRVETATAVPSNLDPYSAVVVQNVAAGELGNIGTLQEFVIDGNGLFITGGPSAFESGNYDNTTLATMLPVQFGESSPGSARIVMAIDVSGSTEGGMKIQKAVALDALSQLGDQTTVGVVGFNRQAYRINNLSDLGQSRDRVRKNIRRLTSRGGTNIANGLRGAEELLDGQRGTVLLISDGVDSRSRSGVVAETLGRQGIRVITIGAGAQVNEPLLQRLADISGGTYFRADQTDRLRILFGGAGQAVGGDSLTVVDTQNYITQGISLEASPTRANDVSVRPGANFLVASPDGDPALATWQFGLGRVATLTTYDLGGSLGGLLDQSDSLLLTKTTNYVIGNPDRKATGFTDAPDTRLNQPTSITYRGSEPPEIENRSFRSVGDEVYEASVTPERIGFHQVGNITYAANYPAEFAGFGSSPALSEAVSATGGQQFRTGEAADIAEFARDQSVRVRDIRREWDWVFITVGLLVFVTEVVLRRVQVYQGHTSLESGLK